MARARGVAWGSLALGAGSVAALPLAIYLTRFSAAYELVHAAVAIPVAGALGIAAVVLSRRRAMLALGRAGHARGVALARVLGVLGILMALSALLAVGVYLLLEYSETRT